MEITYIILGVAAWLAYSFMLYRRQQAKAQTLVSNPDFVKQVAGLVREGKTEKEVADFLRQTYKLPVLSGQLIYRQVKAKLDKEAI